MSKNLAQNSTPLDNVATNTVATLTRDASAIASSGSAFVPTPPKLLRGEPFLKSVQEEKSNWEPGNEISDDLIRHYLGCDNAAAVEKKKDVEPQFDAAHNQYDIAFLAPSDSELGESGTEDACQGEDDDFFSSAIFLETVSTIREEDRPPNPAVSSLNRRSEIDPPLPKPTQEELDSMTDDEAAAAMARYWSLHKNWTDRRLRERKLNSSAGSTGEYSGDMTPSLRLMSEVEVRRLRPRDCFGSKEILRM